MCFLCENSRQVFIWVTGTIDFFMYLIGCMYYLAGSYNPIHRTNYIPKMTSQQEGVESGGMLDVDVDGAHSIGRDNGSSSLEAKGDTHHRKPSAESLLGQSVAEEEYDISLLGSEMK